MDYSPMDQYWIWLSSVEGIGPKRFYQLLTLFEDARGVWDALEGPMLPPDLKLVGPKALQELRTARDAGYFYRLFERLERLGIRAVTRLDDDYPADLASICDPPPTLFIRGECPLDGPRQLAVVGSRKCTYDGQRAAREFGKGLAENGVTVISGMARGIDSCAHIGALDGGGKTIAVLGCGVDTAYPPENEELMARIIDSGGAVVSEYRPGTPPVPGNFPARNRIISGLARGALLVEGAKASGAMITVNLALEQGRDVFAIPGGIYSPLSSAPNQMILEGATPVLSHWDILETYGWAQRPGPSAAQSGKRVELDEQERALVEPLRFEPLSFEELISVTGLSAAKLNSHLTMLELRGIIVKVPGGLYRSYIED
ncbi:MAG: DNA-processing protein DprA [Clostridia bacterium]|nr:DNA-processing protein DprA [Clostridia bacterium]